MAPSSSSLILRVNGDIEETYQWRTPFPTESNFHLPFQKPRFDAGVFSLPAWSERFGGRYDRHSQRITFKFPLPPTIISTGAEVEMDSDTPRYTWRVVEGPKIKIFKGNWTCNPEELQMLQSGRPSWRDGEPLITFHPFVWTRGGEGNILGFEVKMRIEGIRLNMQAPEDVSLRQASLENIIPPTFNVPDLSDFQVLTHDGEVLHCHKLILAAGSPFFKGMFASDNREMNEGQVKFEDVDGKALKLAIEWMYGRDINQQIPSPQDKMELYRVGHQLCILDFPLDTLLSQIMDSMDKKSAFDAYCFAEAFDEEGILARAIEIIQREREEFAGVDFLNECVKRCPSLLGRLRP